MFDFQLNLMRWSLRVNARLMNLSDGYPAFGMTHNDADVVLDIDYPEKSNRISVLLRAMFGILYVLIPHAFLLFFLQIGVMVVRIIAFWAVLRMDQKFIMPTIDEAIDIKINKNP